MDGPATTLTPNTPLIIVRFHGSQQSSAKISHAMTVLWRPPSVRPSFFRSQNTPKIISNKTKTLKLDSFTPPPIHFFLWHHFEHSS